VQSIYWGKGFWGNGFSTQSGNLKKSQMGGVGEGVRKTRVQKRNPCIRSGSLSRLGEREVKRRHWEKQLAQSTNTNSQSSTRNTEKKSPIKHNGKKHQSRQLDASQRGEEKGGYELSVRKKIEEKRNQGRHIPLTGKGGEKFTAARKSSSRPKGCSSTPATDTEKGG